MEHALEAARTCDDISYPWCLSKSVMMERPENDPFFLTTGTSLVVLHNLSDSGVCAMELNKDANEMLQPCKYCSLENFH